MASSVDVQSITSATAFAGRETTYATLQAMSENTPTPTPRTDAAETDAQKKGCTPCVVQSDFARQLETELLSATRERDEALANKQYGWETARAAHVQYEKEHKELLALRAVLALAQAELNCTKP